MDAGAVEIMHKLKLSMEIKCSFQTTLAGRGTSGLFSTLQSAFLMPRIEHTKKNYQSEVLKEAISEVIFLCSITAGHSNYQK